jgi:hypothetical protein
LGRGKSRPPPSEARLAGKGMYLDIKPGFGVWDLAGVTLALEGKHGMASRGEPPYFDVGAGFCTRVQGLGFRVQNLILGVGFRVSGQELRVVAQTSAPRPFHPPHRQIPRPRDAAADVKARLWPCVEPFLVRTCSKTSELLPPCSAAERGDAVVQTNKPTTLNARVFQGATESDPFPRGRQLRARLYTPSPEQHYQARTRRGERVRLLSSTSPFPVSHSSFSWSLTIPARASVLMHPSPTNQSRSRGRRTRPGTRVPR